MITQVVMIELILIINYYYSQQQSFRQSKKQLLYSKTKTPMNMVHGMK